jgi:hypothetical protein
MMREWKYWAEKIVKAVYKVLPGSKVRVSKRMEVDKPLITIVIEVESLPNDKLIIDTIVGEIFKIAELPIYNPFHIILESLDGRDYKLEISKPY